MRKAANSHPSQSANRSGWSQSEENAGRYGDEWRLCQYVLLQGLIALPQFLDLFGGKP
jgi:hypothetical protein